MFCYVFLFSAYYMSLYLVYLSLRLYILDLLLSTVGYVPVFYSFFLVVNLPKVGAF